jgi:hypothetical protein
MKNKTHLNGRVIGQHEVRVSKVGGTRLGPSLALDAQRHVIETPSESHEAARHDNVVVVEGVQGLALPGRTIVERGDKADLEWEGVISMKRISERVRLTIGSLVCRETSFMLWNMFPKRKWTVSRNTEPASGVHERARSYLMNERKKRGD